MNIRIPVAQLDAYGKGRPPEFLAAVRPLLVREGDFLVMPVAEWYRLVRQHRKPRGLGDVIERAVKPIAKALRLDCLDENDRLKPDSPCAKRRDRLNRAFPAS